MIAKIKKTILTFAILVGSLVLLASPSAMALTPDPGNGCSLSNAEKINPVSFFPAWYDGLYCKDANTIVSPGDESLGGAGSNSGARFGAWLTIVAMNVVRMLLFVVGYASIIFIIYGGFKYMTQGDNASGTAAARKTIQNAVIGLVISIMSVSIVTFVVGRIAAQ